MICNDFFFHFNFQIADKGQIEEKEFKCTINNCDRQFAKLGYLKKHQLNEHEADSVPE